MKTTLLLLALAAVAVGCGDSSTSSQNTSLYPLALAKVNATKPGTTAFFTLQVYRGNAIIRGAKLLRRNSPSNQTDTVSDPVSKKPILSDSIGNFVFSYPWPDTVTSVAFQAMSDTARSNFLVFPPF